jgi:hypothetical protein
LDKVLLEEFKKPLNEGRQNLKQRLRKGASADIFDDADLSDATGSQLIKFKRYKFE